MSLMLQNEMVRDGQTHKEHICVVHVYVGITEHNNMRRECREGGEERGIIPCCVWVDDTVANSLCWSTHL